MFKILVIEPYLSAWFRAGENYIFVFCMHLLVSLSLSLNIHTY